MTGSLIRFFLPLVQVGPQSLCYTLSSCDVDGEDDDDDVAVDGGGLDVWIELLQVDIM